VVTQKTAKIIASYKERFVSAKYGDRWLAAVCDDAGIHYKTLQNSYSPCTGNVYNMNDVREMKIAINRNGASYIHGNKKVEVSKQIIIEKVL
jgi:hypothetical protein